MRREVDSKYLESNRCLPACSSSTTTPPPAASRATYPQLHPTREALGGVEGPPRTPTNAADAQQWAHTFCARRMMGSARVLQPWPWLLLGGCERADQSDPWVGEELMTFGPIRDKMEFRPQMFWKRASGLAARDDQKRGYDFNYSGDNSIKKAAGCLFLRQVKPE